MNIREIMDNYTIPDKFLIVGKLNNPIIRTNISPIYMYSARKDTKYFIQEPEVIVFYVEDINRLIIYKPSSENYFSVWTHKSQHGEVEVRLIQGSVDELFRVGLPEILMTVIRKGSINKTMFYGELQHTKPVMPDKAYYDSIKHDEKKPVIITHDVIEQLTTLIDSGKFEVKRIKNRTVFRWESNITQNNMSIDYQFNVPSPKSRVTLYSKLQLRYRSLVRLEIPVIDLLNIEAFNLSELSLVKRLIELIKLDPKEGIAQVNKIVRGDWKLEKLVDKYQVNIFKNENWVTKRTENFNFTTLQTVYKLGMVYELLDLIISTRAVSIIKEKGKDITYINNVGAYYYYKRYFEETHEGLERPLAGYAPSYMTTNKGTILKIRIVNHKDKWQSLVAKSIQPQDFKLNNIHKNGYHYNIKHGTIVLKTIKPGALLLGKDVAVIKVKGSLEGRPVSYIITGLGSIDHALMFMKNKGLQLAKFEH